MNNTLSSESIQNSLESTSNRETMDMKNVRPNLTIIASLILSYKIWINDASEV